MATCAEIQKRWRKVIAESLASGMTQKEFADKHGLGVKSVGRWHRRFDGELNLLPKPRRARKPGSENRPRRRLRRSGLPSLPPMKRPVRPQGPPNPPVGTGVYTCPWDASPWPVFFGHVRFLQPKP